MDKPNFEDMAKTQTKHEKQIKWLIERMNQMLDCHESGILPVPKELKTWDQIEKEIEEREKK